MSGVRAMTKATDRFLTAVRRFSTGVYSSVAAAEAAMMRRSAGGSCKAMRSGSLPPGQPAYGLREGLLSIAAFSRPLMRLQLVLAHLHYVLQDVVSARLVKRGGRKRTHHPVEKSRSGMAHQDAGGNQYRAVQDKAEQQGALQRHSMPWQWLQGR